MRGDTVKPASAFVTAFLVLVTARVAVAHHGVAPHYDADRLVTVEGVIAKFDFINPHSFVYVTVTTETGEEELWQCELASRSVLSRNGVEADDFKPGEPIRIEGIAGRHNPTGCALRTAWFADGSVLRSTEFFGPAATSVPESPADPLSIEGVWTMKEFTVSFYEGVLTPAGEAARSAFDPIADDPAIYCDPASPVRFWVNVNEPFEIRREAERVVVDHRFLDYERIIQLTPDPPPPNAPRSAMGYSVGRFDGRALVISTSHFTAATLEPRRGVLHTEDLALTEHLEVNPETGELEISWTIDDPAYFTEPLTQTEYFVRSTRDDTPYDCKPGYQQ
jgi:hypothetical protein